MSDWSSSDSERDLSSSNCSLSSLLSWLGGQSGSDGSLNSHPGSPLHEIANETQLSPEDAAYDDAWVDQPDPVIELTPRVRPAELQLLPEEGTGGIPVNQQTPISLDGSSTIKRASVNPPDSPSGSTALPVSAYQVSFPNVTKS